MEEYHDIVGAYNNAATFEYQYYGPLLFTRVLESDQLDIQHALFPIFIGSVKELEETFMSPGRCMQA